MVCHANVDADWGFYISHFPAIESTYMCLYLFHRFHIIFHVNIQHDIIIMIITIHAIYRFENFVKRISSPNSNAKLSDFHTIDNCFK